MANGGSAGERNPSFILQKVGEFKFEDRPIPRLQNPTDVLIRIQHTGICGSDVHYWQHGAIGPYVVNSPLVLGHESAGVIEKVGSAVTTLKAGDRVALEPGIPCRLCTFCKAGKYNLCDKMRFAATPPYDGTLARFYTLPEDMCVRLPSEVSLEEGALLEPLAVAVHACRHVSFGNSVVVFGAGPVGLLLAAVAKAASCARSVIVIDINEQRVNFAHSFAGATGIVSKGLSVDEIVEKVAESELMSGGGADIVFEATGVEACIQASVGVVKRGGKIVQVGMGKSIVQYPISDMTVKEVTFCGSFRYSAGDFPMAAKLVADKKVDVSKLVTARYDFLDAEKAFEETKKGTGIKVVIKGPE